MSVENQVIDLLVAAYPKKDAIETLLQRIGVPVSDVDLAGETKHVWPRVWTAVSGHQRTEALVGEVLHDRSVSSHHAELWRLWGDRVQAAGRDVRRAAWSAALDRRAELVLTGGDTSGIDGEILELRRRLREGPTLQANEFLAGRYRLGEVVGKGGFGTVWKAYDRVQQRLVAVKVLHRQWAQDRSQIDRFFSGARQMARLQHPAVVRVLQDRVEDEGFHFFVMDHVAGGDLHAAVLSKRIDRQAAVRAVVQVGGALAHAHAKGFVHRDVKPHNILVDGQGGAWLTDFDLVHALDTTHGTRTGVGMGSFLYAAPELLTDAARSDARADVYGLAMTAAFCLHGAVPGEALYETQAFLDGLDAPTAVKAALRRGLAKRVAQRDIGVAELCRALEGVGGAPEPGSHWVFQAAGLRIEAVWVPAGTFWMGATKEPGQNQDPEAYDDEAPVHRVTVPQGFWLGRHPVTVAQYRAFCAATAREEPEAFRRPQLKADDLPVTTVSWNDAMVFCRWLSELLGDGVVDLPTEAEWEWAARGTDGRRYPWGHDRPDLERAWYGGYGWDPQQRMWVQEQGEHHDRVRAPAPVGGRPRGTGPFGAEDQAGNVWEWCKSVHRPYEDRERIDDWRLDDMDRHESDTADGAPRVLRGGSWVDSAWVLRAARRFGYHLGHRGHRVGFRVVFRSPSTALVP